jgi:hypothetical protein
LEFGEVSELLNQKATAIENFKRRSKRLFRGYTEKDQKRISELEEELSALKLKAETLPKVLLRCLTCGDQVCDRLFLWAKPPSFRGGPVVVDWVHECGGDLVCHPPAFHYNRSGANPDPVITLDARCRVVSAANCDPEHYKIGSHPSGTEEFILDSGNLEQASQTLERIKDGFNSPPKEEGLLPAGTDDASGQAMSQNQTSNDEVTGAKPVDRSEEAVRAKERDLFNRLLKVKVYPAVPERETLDRSVDSKPENKSD